MAQNEFEIKIIQNPKETCWESRSDFFFNQENTTSLWGGILFEPPFMLLIAAFCFENHASQEGEVMIGNDDGTA